MYILRYTGATLARRHRCSQDKQIIIMNVCLSVVSIVCARRWTAMALLNTCICQALLQALALAGRFGNLLVARDLTYSAHLTHLTHPAHISHISQPSRRCLQVSAI